MGAGAALARPGVDVSGGGGDQLVPGQLGHLLVKRERGVKDVWSGGVKLGLLAEVFPLGQPASAAALEEEEEGNEGADQDNNDNCQQPGLTVSAENLGFLKYDRSQYSLRNLPRPHRSRWETTRSH